MPLQDLVNYFNQRFIEENHLHAPPLAFDGRQALGRFGGTVFTTRLRPVRLAAAAAMVVGHDASTLLQDGADGGPDRYSAADEPGGIVTADRLARTVHMLNYLPVAADAGTLFLPVHPRHLLAVQRDHGAYFEDIILRCGLTVGRVAISLAVSPAFDRELHLLLKRLQSYRDRGYATAVTFDEAAGSTLLERYCLEFLYRFTPDFVRFDIGFFQDRGRNAAEIRRRLSLVSAIHRLDTALLLTGIAAGEDAGTARQVGADLVQGEWYESGLAFAEPRAAAGGRTRR
jgi:EAL domain-containing protein (putative c-di-GMP-specific phosphodiesterase class I)